MLPGVPKWQRMQRHQPVPVRYFVNSDQNPSRMLAKACLKGIMCMADEAEILLIFLIYPSWQLIRNRLAVFSAPSILTIFHFSG